MRETLQPGLSFEFRFTVPEEKTVPYLYPESPEFQVMPKVLATGFMVGLFEWACIRAVNPHIDWPREQTVGIDVKLSHLAATPPGLTVRIQGTLEKVEGRKLTFSLIAEDGVDRISEGTHERFVIDAAKFNSKAAAKASRALKVPPGTRCAHRLESNQSSSFAQRVFQHCLSEAGGAIKQPLWSVQQFEEPSGLSA
jgi:fluoroacetyl-CoA thioesterase